MNNQPILFVSSRCSNCAKIIETLKQLNKDTLCRMFYIDGKQRHELPAFLKSVPTLYVPESKDVYVGKDIYSYIAKPVVSRREVPVAQAQQAGPGTTTAAARVSGRVVVAAAVALLQGACRSSRVRTALDCFTRVLLHFVCVLGRCSQTAPATYTHRHIFWLLCVM